MDKRERYETMLFNNETVNRTDFQPTAITAPINTLYKSKSRCLMLRPPPLKDIHTLSEWKELQVPFDLLHKPKDVVRENPEQVQQPCSWMIDHERKSVQMTRPRLVMTPAVSMDDIADDKAREILCKDMYTSTVMKANAEGAMICSNIQSPFPGRPAPANPITLPPLRPAYVAPEWRVESIPWDGKQLRSYADPTKEFWLDRSPRCSVCDDTMARGQQNKLALQMTRGR